MMIKQFKNLTDDESLIMEASGVSNFDILSWLEQERFRERFKMVGITKFCYYLLDSLIDEHSGQVINKSFFISTVSDYFTKDEINGNRNADPIKPRTIKSVLLNTFHLYIEKGKLSEFKLSDSYYKAFRTESGRTKAGDSLLAGKLVKVLRP